jgi:hypothetical protein
VPPKAPESAPAQAEKPKADRVSYVSTFARLAALVPAGSWPATLPVVYTAPEHINPVALGIGKRVEELLPAEERKAFHKALKALVLSGPYLQALAADESVRWLDDGTPGEPVSEEHRQSAVATLMQRVSRQKGGK